MTEVKLRVISLGAGVQSTTMALMAAHGLITPMPDCAIFADTGAEPKVVYDHLNWLSSPNVLPFPVHRIDAGRSLTSDLEEAANPMARRQFVAVPFFTRSFETVRGAAGTDIGTYQVRGIGRRQCTKEFKLEPITKEQRRLLGYLPRQRIPIGSAEVLIGISKDEADRAKPSKWRWQTNRFPLLELKMDRRACLQWLREHEYPEPPKSACVFCPYRANESWVKMRDEQPEDWQEAIRIDHLLRSNGMMRGMRLEQFVHDSLVPLDEADLLAKAPRGGADRDLFANECEGMCGV